MDNITALLIYNSFVVFIIVVPIINDRSPEEIIDAIGILSVILELVLVGIKIGQYLARGSLLH